MREVLRRRGEKIAGQRCVIQGFGNVGRWAARILHEQGAKIMAVSDAGGGVFAGDGLDIPELVEHMGRSDTVADYEGGEPISNADLLIADCDVLMPAALGHVLHAGNARDVKARFVLEGANEPTTREADEILESRGITCIPDILANAGGVTVSFFEWAQNIQQFRWTEERVLEELEMQMCRALSSVCEAMERHAVSMRKAAFIVAIERVKDATDLRGLE